MKVKNIMFSGFAAAVLAGVCGAAEAADYTLASQGYVTKQLEGKQDKLEAGEGIAIDGKKISASFTTEGGKTVTMGALVDSVASVEDKLAGLPEGKTVAEALSEKQATLGNAAVLETITSDDVASIGTTASAVQSLSGTVGKITNAEGATSTVAAEITALRSGIADADAAASEAASAAGEAASAAAEAQADVDALESVVGQNTTDIAKKLDKTVYEQHIIDQDARDDAQDALIDSMSGITGDGGSLSKLQTTVTKLDGDVNVSGSVANQIAAAISAEEERADLAYAPASLTETVSGLADTVATKADASALQNYVGTGTFTEYQGTVTTALSGKQDTIEGLDAIKSGAAAGATAVQPGTLTETLKDYQAAGNYLTDTMTVKGTYLVKRAEDGTVSYVSVDVIGENGNPVEF